MKTKLEIIQKLLLKLKEKQRLKRIRESELLSPEFDFLEIDDDGYLITPYPIIDSVNYTRDKVLAAGIIYGLQKKGEDNTYDGFFTYLEGIDEIKKRVHRKNKELVNEKKERKIVW